MRRFQHFTAQVLLAAALLVTSGCFVTPKTTALRQVHDTYRDDFIAFSVPAPSAKSLLAAAPAQFSKSLQAIRDYRVKYPGDSAEQAHLKVLEGMIYVQSGRFGLAEAVKDDVKTAGAKLGSGTGRTVRDRLFSANFSTLLAGWAETGKQNARDWQVFEKAANELSTSLTNTPLSQLADPDADQGAVYLANCAAIFYVWAYSTFADIDLNKANEKKKVWFTQGRDLIGRFLTPAEMSDQTRKDINQTLEGRLRYVQWYHWLDQNK